MNVLYEYEQELLDAGYDFEPKQEGYNIDNLNEEDRGLLSGMLYVFYDILPAWKLICQETNFGTLGKIFNEYLDESYKKLEEVFLMYVQDFVVGCLDGYEEEEKE